MSFLRHQEIYPFDQGATLVDRALPHRTDEFPAGYSSAGCTPADPASASPAGSHLARHRLHCTIEFQRTAGSVLTACLRPGDHPKVCVKCQKRLLPRTKGLGGAEQSSPIQCRRFAPLCCRANWPKTGDKTGQKCAIFGNRLSIRHAKDLKTK